MSPYDILYILVIGLTWPAWILFALLNPKARHGFSQRLGKYPELKFKTRPVWIHCASVGEVALAAQFIKKVQERGEEVEWLITSNTKTGIQNAEKLLPAVPCVYAPLFLSVLDLGACVGRFLNRYNPRLLVLVELEVWPNWVHHLARRRVETMVINGRISDRSYPGYRLFRPFYWKTFRHLARVLTLDALIADRFKSLGTRAENVAVTGSMKFDIALDPATALKEALLRELNLQRDESILLGASIHPGEEIALLRAYQKARESCPGLRLILVPRHIEKIKEFQENLKKAGCPKVFLYSEWSAEKRLVADTVLLVDQVGILKSFYALATLVFVGGSLVKHGGQNMLEPLALGRPVIVGPHTQNFRAIMDTLNKEKAVKVVKNEAELITVIPDYIQDSEKRNALSHRGLVCLKTGQGATRKNVLHFLQVIQKPEP